MKLNITPLNQRDPRWKDQRLGTKNGTTIGSDGCVVTSASMMYTFYGKPTMPDQLDNFLTDNILYYNQSKEPANLWVPANVSKWLAGMKFDRMVKCGTTPAPITEIKAYLDQGKPVFVWVMNNNVFHCVLAVGYEGNEIIVNDPWRGDTVRVDQRWGKSDLAILEVDFYSGQKTDNALEACLKQHGELITELETVKRKLALTEQDNTTQKATIDNLRKDLTASQDKVKQLQDENSKLKGAISKVREGIAGV